MSTGWKNADNYPLTHKEPYISSNTTTAIYHSFFKVNTSLSIGYLGFVLRMSLKFVWQMATTLQRYLHTYVATGNAVHVVLFRSIDTAGEWSSHGSCTITDHRSDIQEVSADVAKQVYNTGIIRYHHGLIPTSCSGYQRTKQQGGSTNEPPKTDGFSGMWGKPRQDSCKTSSDQGVARLRCPSMIAIICWVRKCTWHHVPRANLITVEHTPYSLEYPVTF